MSQFDIHTRSGRVIPVDDYRIEDGRTKYIEPYTHRVKTIPTNSIDDVVENNRNVLGSFGKLFEPKF